VMPPPKRLRLLPPAPASGTCPRTGESLCFCASDALFSQGRWLDAAQSLLLLVPQQGQQEQQQQLPPPPQQQQQPPPPPAQQPCCALMLRLGRAWLFAYKGAMQLARCPEVRPTTDAVGTSRLLSRAVAALRTAVSAVSGVHVRQESVAGIGRTTLAQARAAHHFLAEALSLQQCVEDCEDRGVVGRRRRLPALATTAAAVHAQAVQRGLWRDASQRPPRFDPRVDELGRSRPWHSEHDHQAFPWAQVLCESWPVVRDEYATAYAAGVFQKVGADRNPADAFLTAPTAAHSVSAAASTGQGGCWEELVLAERGVVVRRPLRPLWRRFD
jgi:hypothetical protein